MEKALQDLQSGDVVDVFGLSSYHTKETFAVVTELYEEDTKTNKGRIVPGAWFMGDDGRLHFLSGSWQSRDRMIKMAPEDKAKEFKDKWLGMFLTQKPAPLVGRGTTGCDPEIFLVNEKDEVIPAWEFLPAKEARNHQYWDGFQAEFIIPDGRGCLEQLNDQIRAQLYGILRAARVKNPKANFSLANVVKVPMEILTGADAKYVELGCKPSLNVYGDKGKEVADPRRLYERFAGGHQHYGLLGGGHSQMIPKIIKALDAVMGVAGVSLAAEIDHPSRREYYGRAGEYRTPKHGLEYRVLSNFWLIHPAVSMLVNELFRVTIRWAQSGMSHMWNADEKEVREVINNCDVEKARAMLVKNAKVLEALFFNTNFGGMNAPARYMVDAAMYTTINGLETIGISHDIEKNWGLGKGGDEWSYMANKWGSFASSNKKLPVQGAKARASR